MSSLVFPSLPGLSWGIKRTPVWNTLVKKTPSGREFRGRLQNTPLRQYSLQYEVLRAGAGMGEVQQLEGFFNQVAGSWDTFLYNDPDDNTAVNQAFGIGDGVSTQFQLVRTRGGFVEPVYDFNGAPTLSSGDGALAAANGGRVVYATPPAAGTLLTWSGAYYWRCRFLQDTTEFSQFLHDLWEAKKVEFITVKP